MHGATLEETGHKTLVITTSYCTLVSCAHRLALTVSHEDVKVHRDGD